MVLYFESHWAPTGETEDLTIIHISKDSSSVFPQLPDTTLILRGTWRQKVLFSCS